MKKEFLYYCNKIYGGFPLVRVFSNSKKLKFFGVDMPMVDYTIPHINYIEKNLKSKNATTDDIAKANKLYDSILEIFGEYSHGGKYSFNEEQSTTARNLTYEMEAFLLNYNIKIKFTGGTVYNKMYNLKAILGDSIECNLVGTVGKDPSGDFLYNKIKSEGINLINNGELISATREAVHIIPRDETDRIIGKFKYNTPSFMNYDFITKNALNNDVIFIEGSGLKFMGGADNLKKHIDALNEAHKKSIFSPPTDTSFYFDSETKTFQRDNTEALVYTGKNSDLIYMNEKEAISYTGNPRFKRDISGYNDEIMQVVRKRIISKIIKNEEKPEQLVFVTMGDKGSLGINKEHEVFQPSQADVKIVSTSGCGDSFAAATTAQWCKNQKSKHTKDYLKDLLQKGTQVAGAVIQEIPAQIPVDTIKKAFERRPTMIEKQGSKVLEDFKKLRS